MKFIDCPVIGTRPHTEFAISGVLEVEPAEIEDMPVAAWTFNRHSIPGERVECWYHTSTQLWFNVTRDTGTDQISQVDLMRRPDE